jgi:hypothetical protein
MKYAEYMLFIGIIVGAVLWGSVVSLIENNNLLSIIGLGFACLVMGITTGYLIKGETK